MTTNKPKLQTAGVCPPVDYTNRVWGIQHDLEWGHAVVGVRPTVVGYDGSGLRPPGILRVRGVSFFVHPADVTFLTLQVGGTTVLVGPPAVHAARQETDFITSPDDPMVFVFRVEPSVAHVGLSLMGTVPTQAAIHFDVKTLDLMPLDVDPALIDFRGLLWPND